MAILDVRAISGTDPGGTGRVGWREDIVDSWIENRPAVDQETSRNA